MSAVRYRIDPRLVPPEKVARRLGVTFDRFRASVPDLERSGFPKPLSVLGNYCLQAVDNWIDSQSGLTTATTPESAREKMKRAISERAWDR